MASVLVVDDSYYTRQSLKKILTEGGHFVVAEAANGFDALEKYKIYHPDLVTMDITMPLVSGLDAVRNILEIFPDAAIIMVSSLDQKCHVFEAIELGARHYIIKPLDYDKIMRVVDKVLDAKKQRLKYLHSIDEGRLLQLDLPEKLTVNHLGEIVQVLTPTLRRSGIRIVFNFGNTEALEDRVLKKLLSFVHTIQQAQGRVVFFSKKAAFITFMADEKVNYFIGLYSGELDISSIEI